MAVNEKASIVAMRMEGKGLETAKVSERARCGGLVLCAPVQPDAFSPSFSSSCLTCITFNPPSSTLIATRPIPFPQGPCSLSSLPSLIHPTKVTRVIQNLIWQRHKSPTTSKYGLYGGISPRAPANPGVSGAPVVRNFCNIHCLGQNRSFHVHE